MINIKRVTLAAFFFIAVNVYAGGKKVTITGTATETQEVLSGIRPTEEMEKEWKRAKPSANKTFYIRKGNTNKYTKKVYCKFTTDSSGNFKITLPPGTYCIVEKVKRDKLTIPDYSVQNKALPNYSHFQVGDKKCFDEWYGQCDATVEVKDKNITGLIFNIHHGHNAPCVQGGPIPQ